MDRPQKFDKHIDGTLDLGPQFFLIIHDMPKWIDDLDSTLDFEDLRDLLYFLGLGVKE